jgi:hypothetical protein
MKTTYSNGCLNLHVGALLDTLNDDAKKMMIEHLACESAIIRAVTEQILDGVTEEGFSGAECCLAEPDPQRGLDWARREVARRAGDAAAKEIKRLENALAFALKQIQEYQVKRYERDPW